MVTNLQGNFPEGLGWDFNVVIWDGGLLRACATAIRVIQGDRVEGSAEGVLSGLFSVSIRI